MSARASWRTRFPEFALVLEDPRVQSVLFDASGAIDARDAFGQRLELRAPEHPLPQLRSMANSASTYDDEVFTFHWIPTVDGGAMHVRRRDAVAAIALPAELSALLETALAAGASVLVVGPSFEARGRALELLARLAREHRRLLSTERTLIPGVFHVAASALSRVHAIEYACFVVPDLDSSDATSAMFAPTPCLAAMAGLDSEVGLARLVAQLATERQGVDFLALVGLVARRFDVVLECDDHEPIAAGEAALEAATLNVRRFAWRGASGRRWTLACKESRLARLLDGRPRFTSTADARGGTDVDRSLLRRGANAQAGVGSIEPSPQAARLPVPPLATPSWSAEDAPPVQGELRAPASGGSDVAQALEERAGGVAASAVRTGGFRLDDLPELTPDQLVSRSFVAQMPSATPGPAGASSRPPAHRFSTAPDAHVRDDGRSRTPLERLPTELLPPHAAPSGSPARGRARPRDDSSSEGAVLEIGEESVVDRLRDPASIDGRTAMGLLSSELERAPTSPPSSAAGPDPVRRRSKT